MTRSLALSILGSVLVLSVLGTLIVLPRMRRNAALAERLRWRGARGVAPRQNGEALAGLIGRIGNALLATGVVGAGTLDELRRTVTAAGFRGSASVSVFLGAKILLALLLPTVAWVATRGGEPGRQIIIVAVAVGFGLLLPDLALRSVRQRHRKAVSKGLPDALDLLVICAEAGLPLDAAVERVAAELADASPAVAGELALTATELRILSDRRSALLNMGTRTELDSLRRLGGTLAQTLQYGTPLTQALRALAVELRHETLMAFETRAARLPALLTLPTILFILPCLFLVVGGPAVLRVLDLFGGP
ncbi:type II secretion system F family protein [Roseomonas nepalensis]|uniref:Type II secretion system F family protein n=1 Tax=Muricoccus nepalensis TaxID=1854500 RepID=A0A502GE08_9PROT|nr:type II secretion system F family protein [Roseomonas nepalensis]TPG59758.1 type II secretion system F family protein [Roseomonas nepalensis]